MAYNIQDCDIQGCNNLSMSSIGFVSGIFFKKTKFQIWPMISLGPILGLEA